MQRPPILIILCIHVQKLGRQDLLFHSRMIRPVVGGGTCPPKTILLILSIDVNFFILLILLILSIDVDKQSTHA